MDVTEYIENFSFFEGQNFSTVDENELKALEKIDTYIKKELKNNYGSIEEIDYEEFPFVEFTPDKRDVTVLRLIYFHEIAEFDFSVFRNLQEIMMYYPAIDAYWYNQTFYSSDNEFGYYSPSNLPTFEPVAFPESLTDCQMIETISINNIPLINIPESLSRLTRLTALTLYNTDLKNLPDAIGLLPHLKSLRVFNGNITELPATIGNLQELEVLEINHNPLVHIPASIGNCQNLSIISFKNTLVREVPKSLLLHPYLYNLLNDEEFKGAPILQDQKYRGIIKKKVNYGSFYAALYLLFIVPGILFFGPFLLLFDPYYKKFRKRFSYILKGNQNGLNNFFLVFFILLWIFFSFILSPYVIVTLPIFLIWYALKKIGIMRYKRKVRGLSYE